MEEALEHGKTLMEYSLLDKPQFGLIIKVTCLITSLILIWMNTLSTLISLMNGRVRWLKILTLRIMN